MLNFNPQLQPGMFPAVDAAVNNIPPITPYILAALLAVGGYFVGINQDRVPVALCIALGLVLGLIFVPLLGKLASFLIGFVMVGVTALLAFWLLSNDAALKNQVPSGMTQHAPTHRDGLFEHLRSAVLP